MKILLIIVALFLLIYVLYANGFIMVRAKRSAIFVSGMMGLKARFSSCTGYTMRVIKFRESGEYEFELDCEISSGGFAVEILDTEKNSLMNLTPENGKASVLLQAKKRYYLLFRYNKASGKYELSYKKAE